MHWDQEPIRFGPRAVPARSGRAKTRAWVIFQGCWRGPHAATGDRSRSALRTGNSRATAGSWREPSFVFSAWIGTMNLTTRWERGSVSRSASLQPQVLRVTDPRSGTPGSWRAPTLFLARIGVMNPRCSRRCLAERGDDGSRGFQPTVYGPKN